MRDVFRLIEQDVDFIVAKYANERGHLRKLWAGAAPGSIGFLKPLCGTVPLVAGEISAD